MVTKWQTFRAGSNVDGVGNENWAATEKVLETRNYTNDQQACQKEEKVLNQSPYAKEGLWFALHYYTHPGDGENKGSATDFTETEWYETMKRTYYMEELCDSSRCNHGQVRPRKKVGMIVDEWDVWFDVEPATNPGFYQQNTMRNTCRN